MSGVNKGFGQGEGNVVGQRVVIASVSGPPSVVLLGFVPGRGRGVLTPRCWAARESGVCYSCRNVVVRLDGPLIVGSRCGGGLASLLVRRR
jgi:hypothetical protein